MQKTHGGKNGSRLMSLLGKWTRCWHAAVASGRSIVEWIGRSIGGAFKRWRRRELHPVLSTLEWPERIAKLLASVLVIVVITRLLWQVWYGPVLVVPFDISPALTAEGYLPEEPAEKLIYRLSDLRREGAEALEDFAVRPGAIVWYDYDAPGSSPSITAGGMGLSAQSIVRAIRSLLGVGPPIVRGELLAHGQTKILAVSIGDSARVEVATTATRFVDVLVDLAAQSVQMEVDPLAHAAFLMGRTGDDAESFLAMCEARYQGDRRMLSRVMAMKGLALGRRGRVDDARTMFTKAISIDRRSAGGYWGLGNILMNVDEPKEALREYRRALACDPGNASILTCIGQALRAQNRVPEAIAMLDKAVRSDVWSISARSQLSMVLAGAGRNDEAQRQFAIAYAVSLSFHVSPFARAVFLNDAGRFQEALPVWEAIARGDKTRPAVFALMAVALRGLPTPRTDDALRQIRHAIELSPNSYRYYTILGALLYEKDRPRDALDAYRKGLAIAPDDFMLLNNEAVQLGNLGRQAEEFEAWVKLVRKNPRRTTGYTGLALSMQKTKRYSDAVPLLRAGIPHFGRDPFLYGLLGEGEGALEHSAVAGECFRKMIDNASSQAVRAEGWLYLGVSEAKRNNWREAIDSYSMALALEPNRTQARYLLAEAYRMSGRVGEAKRFYSQVVRLDPKGYWGKGAAWNLQKLNEAQ